MQSTQFEAPSEALEHLQTLLKRIAGFFDPAFDSRQATLDPPDIAGFLAGTGLLCKLLRLADGRTRRLNAPLFQLQFGHSAPRLSRFLLVIHVEAQANVLLVTVARPEMVAAPLVALT